MQPIAGFNTTVGVRPCLTAANQSQVKPGGSASSCTTFVSLCISNGQFTRPLHGREHRIGRAFLQGVPEALKHGRASSSADRPWHGGVLPLNHFFSFNNSTLLQQRIAFVSPTDCQTLHVSQTPFQLPRPRPNPNPNPLIPRIRIGRGPASARAARLWTASVQVQ